MYKVWPMGCKKVKDDEQLEKLINDPNYAAQMKIDGVRCIMHIGQCGEVRYTTRGATLDDPSRPIEITHRLQHLPRELHMLHDSIFDGELYYEKLTSSEVAGMVSYRSTVDVDMGIRLNIFDVIRLCGTNVFKMPWYDRMAELAKYAGYIQSFPKLVIVPYVECSDCKRQLLHEEFENDREGVVFKNIFAPYRIGRDSEDHNKPANVWYKYKKKDTIDVYITGSTPPEQFYRNTTTGEYDLERTTKPWDNGWFGSINFTSKEKKFSGACSGISDDMRRTLSDGQHNIKPEYIGRCMEVEYMERTSDGNLRHPRFVRIREEIEK